ncbi:hypothetical protein V7798_01085 [Rhizobium laguerreae]
MSICTFAPVISSNSPVIFASRVTEVSPIPSIFSVIPLKGLSCAIAPVAAAQREHHAQYMSSPSTH